MKNGYDENAKHGECTLDRIDNNGDYEPSNCRWATAKVQRLNRRDVNYISFNGETLCEKEWSKRLNGGHGLVSRRLKAGWSIEDAVSIPSRRRSVSDG